MSFLRSLSGLTPHVPSPPLPAGAPGEVLTEEAAVCPPRGPDLRVRCLVEEGAQVAQGAAVAALRDAPDIRLVAPMPARVARISLRPGHRLSQVVLFREAAGDALRHDVSGAGEAEGLRRLMQRAGFWPWLRRRPFGGMPGQAERPAAILVMGLDTRPHAPDPLAALAGREEDFARGMRALALLTQGPIHLCLARGAPAPGIGAAERVVPTRCGPRHPQGAAGLQVHRLAPARLDRVIWEVHAEDVAALGALLRSGVLEMSRLVSITGGALREARLVRAQAGADLRGLTHRIVRPGPHLLLAGSALDGREAHWLAPRERQVTVLPRPETRAARHWLAAALTRSARPEPVIPSAALTQAFGGALPAAPFLRALSAGDDETAMRLGVLSLLEEDVALADYMLGGELRLAQLLRGMLDRIETELAP